jgi:hypothetical protein
MMVFAFPDKPSPSLTPQLGYLFLGLLGVITANALRKMSDRIKELEERLKEKGKLTEES